MIQIFPPRFVYLVITRLAASICRAVTSAVAMALRPWDPKHSAFPVFDLPLNDPLRRCSFLCFCFRGCNITSFV